MEGNHHLTVPEGTGKERVAWRNSSRFKLTIFSVILVVYGIVFSGLFITNSLRYAKESERLSDLRGSYYDEFPSIAQVNRTLNSLLTTSTAGSGERFEAACDWLQVFIQAHLSDPENVYTYDLGIMCGHYLDTARAAAAVRQTGADSRSLLDAYDECADVYATLQAFSPYATEEMETAVGQKLTAARHSMTETIRYIILFLVLATAAMILLIVRFSGYFLHPVEELAALIRRVQPDTWQITQPPQERSDEMGLLYSVFYEMMNQIRRQYDALLEKQAIENQLSREREKNIAGQALLARTKLKVFQSQINSHFLFNTLNMISSLAYMEEAPRTMDASKLLAQFLRSVLNQFGKNIALSEDFETLNEYVQIQKMRFGSRIEFEAYMDAELCDVKVPSMTLQPLVENALVHGVAGSQHGFIRYSAESTDDGMIISVFDDGSGMSPQEALALEQKVMGALQQPEDEILADEESRHGIGLTNVCRRLNLLYPGLVRFTAESEEQEYTRISITIRL